MSHSSFARTNDSRRVNLRLSIKKDLSISHLALNQLMISSHKFLMVKSRAFRTSTCSFKIYRLRAMIIKTSVNGPTLSINQLQFSSKKSKKFKISLVSCLDLITKKVKVQCTWNRNIF